MELWAFPESQVKKLKFGLASYTKYSKNR
jgi:hypothetical protein